MQPPAKTTQKEEHTMSNNIKKEIIHVLNQLPVIDESGGDDAYVIVENNIENRAALNDVGITNEVIARYSNPHDGTFCILTLAFSEGYADLYVGGQLVCFDKHIEFGIDDEKGQSIIVYKHNNETVVAFTNGASVTCMPLDASQKQTLIDILAAK